MIKKLVIDDERTFDFDAVYARTSEEGLAQLLSGLVPHESYIEELWLDHDLGGEDTIRPVVSWLEEMAILFEPLSIKLIVIHTANPVARSWMRAALEPHYRVVVADAAAHVMKSDE